MQADTFPEIEHNKEKRLTPKELFKKHLQDPDHRVTDEEIRNLKVGMEAEEDVEVSEDSGVKNEKISTGINHSTLLNTHEVLR